MIRVYLPIYRDGQPLLIKTRIITLRDPVSVQFCYGELIYFERYIAIFSKIFELVSSYRCYGSLDIANASLLDSDLKLHLLLCYGVYKRD